MNNFELFINGGNVPKALSKQEIYELLKRIKCGDDNARENLILHNIRLVLYQVTNSFETVNYDKRELVSIGNIGLMKAVETFDMSKNIEFSTYAVRCINNEILMFLKKQKKYQNIDSLDKPIYHDKDGHSLKLGDIIYDENDMTEKYIDDEEYRIIRQIVNNLPNPDKKIVMLYFGFYNNQTYTQREIADIVSINRTQIFRILKRVMNKIKQQLQQQGIIELKLEQLTKLKSK